MHILLTCSYFYLFIPRCLSGACPYFTTDAPTLPPTHQPPIDPGVHGYMCFLRGGSFFLWAGLSPRLFVIPNLKISNRKDPKQPLINTILEGFLVDDEVKGKHSVRFLVHDTICFSGHSLGLQPHSGRMKCAEVSCVTAAGDRFLGCDLGSCDLCKVVAVLVRTRRGNGSVWRLRLVARLRQTSASVLT